MPRRQCLNRRGPTSWPSPPELFPEDGLAVAPKRGTALIYRSKTELLHFSEPVTKPGVEKAILQLLIDYRHAFKKGETVTDFETGASYVYE